MGEKGLVDFFEQYLQRESIFKNKTALQLQHTPEQILHRDEQIQQFAKVIAPCLKSEKPSNLFIYGKPGTGKTLIVRHVTDNIAKISQNRHLPIKIIYANCKLKHIADTEYRLLVQLLREFNKIIPPTGLPTEEVYRFFYQTIDEQPLQLVLVLDEIDELVGKVGNDVLYNLTRCSSILQKTQVTLIGICNNLMFTDALDPRVKSSLSEEELIFPPYNATQLQGILRARAKEAFQPDVLASGVIEKCAAYAAREHGDARRAIDLLRVAGELAERSMVEKVTLEHLDAAEEKLEKDNIIDAITNQPKQYHTVFYAICRLAAANKNTMFTGEVYAKYQGVCEWAKLRPLTQRRVSDVLGELDMLGLIHAPIISKGRYGRTRQIQLTFSPEIIRKITSILEESLALSSHVES